MLTIKYLQTKDVTYFDWDDINNQLKKQLFQDPIEISYEKVKSLNPQTNAILTQDNLNHLNKAILKDPSQNKIHQVFTQQLGNDTSPRSDYLTCDDLETMMFGTQAKQLLKTPFKRPRVASPSTEGSTRAADEHASSTDEHASSANKTSRHMASKQSSHKKSLPDLADESLKSMVDTLKNGEPLSEDQKSTLRSHRWPTTKTLKRKDKDNSEYYIILQGMARSSKNALYSSGARDRLRQKFKFLQEEYKQAQNTISELREELSELTARNKELTSKIDNLTRGSDSQRNKIPNQGKKPNFFDKAPVSSAEREYSLELTWGQ